MKTYNYFLLDLSSEEICSVTHNSGLKVGDTEAKVRMIEDLKFGGRDCLGLVHAEGHLRWLRSVIWRAGRLSPCECL